MAVPGRRSVDPLDGLSRTPLGSKSRFRVTRGTQRLRITRLHVDSEHFQRAAFEPLNKQ